MKMKMKMSAMGAAVLLVMATMLNVSVAVNIDRRLRRFNQHNSLVRESFSAAVGNFQNSPFLTMMSVKAQNDGSLEEIRDSYGI